MKELVSQVFENPLQSLIIVGNLVIIESLLSVDNAVVLATIVMDLPKNQRSKALRYGIFGAYLFRGLAMAFASSLISIWWLKPFGGIYLIYLFYDFWKGKQATHEKKELNNKQDTGIYRVTVGLIGNFWATVFLIELMDVAFSLDNIFAAVAFTPNIILVYIGVFIGMLAIRFIAQWFVKLIKQFNFLESAAYIVIGILGIKLSASLLQHFYPGSGISTFLGSAAADLATSLLTISVFILPVISSLLFKFPKRNNDQGYNKN